MQLQRIAAVIVAAGRGSRLRSDRGVKQYIALGSGETVLALATRAFVSHPAIDRVQVVIHADDRGLYDAAMANCRSDKLAEPAVGGASRQDSVRRGLEALARNGDFDAVLIHDAARPFVTASEITRVIAALETMPGAILAVPVVDTLKRTERAQDGVATIAGTVPRTGLWRAQTPQGFRFEAILAAHQAAARDSGHEFTDDAAIAEAQGLTVAVVAGSERNFKITDCSDLARAEREVAGIMSEQRTGTGFDVHAFAAGDHVTLCGVDIAHDVTLSGHSDADVAMHALTDAIYGALADGDIGSHFPPSDPQWKGAASHIFLAHARDLVAARGGRIVNIDVTIICEAPKIGPHRDAMRTRLAEILAIDISRIAVKATTTEQLGFTGRREGIAAMASATLALNPSEDG